jgi:D-psicose/D-tagatose/L-ribulose 3-epimerase
VLASFPVGIVLEYEHQGKDHEMTKVGIFYAYWVHDWDVDFHPYIDKASEIGFDLIELNAGTVADMTLAERNALKAHADEKGVKLSYVVGLQHQYDIASADNTVRKNGITYLQKMAKAIGEMGGGPVGGILYGAWPATLPEGESDKRPYFLRSVKSMKEAVKAAEDSNVYFCMEVVNRFEQYLLNTCEEGIQYVQAVESPNAKVMLDTFHINIEEDFFGKAISRAGDLLGHFHVGEPNRMPPGYGRIPWVEVATTLRDINYKGYIVMEPFLMPGGRIGRDIKVFRDLSTGLNLDDEARKALMFIRGVLK